VTFPAIQPAGGGQDEKGTSAVTQGLLRLTTLPPVHFDLLAVGPRSAQRLVAYLTPASAPVEHLKE
jgi:hypothetical protein